MRTMAGSILTTRFPLIPTTTHATWGSVHFESSTTIRLPPEEASRRIRTGIWKSSHTFSMEHRDSMGTGSIIQPGEAQRMSAGTGITHSEFNASKTDPVHLLQIWILPDAKGIKPSYEQKELSR